MILLVSDMKKSIELYGNVLGTELKHKTEDWVEFSNRILCWPLSKKENENENEKITACS
jgi:catechol 2,3-dioxygenase-like lactoylglutathione lyase family enzyme